MLLVLCLGCSTVDARPKRQAMRAVSMPGTDCGLVGNLDVRIGHGIVTACADESAPIVDIVSNPIYGPATLWTAIFTDRPELCDMQRRLFEIHDGNLEALKLCLRDAVIAEKSKKTQLRKR
jgi:hypothetical protein